MVYLADQSFVRKGLSSSSLEVAIVPLSQVIPPVIYHPVRMEVVGQVCFGTPLEDFFGLAPEVFVVGESEEFVSISLCPLRNFHPNGFSSFLQTCGYWLGLEVFHDRSMSSAQRRLQILPPMETL